jgi:hypothetical protein
MQCAWGSATGAMVLTQKLLVKMGWREGQVGHMGGGVDRVPHGGTSSEGWGLRGAAGSATCVVVSN